MLRALLKYAREDQSVNALADAARAEPQRAFVSASLRPYLLAGLLDSEPERPALVVAGDDRAARDLTADLRAILTPRQVRFYPARGMRYESHLAPPPHLVGADLEVDLPGAPGRAVGAERDAAGEAAPAVVDVAVAQVRHPHGLGREAPLGP